MNTTQLKYFVTLARTLNYSTAAAQLYVTQPTLSRSIMALEDEIGTKLFYRESGKVALTPAGELFLHDMEPLALRYGGLLQRVQNLGKGLAGTLHIALASEQQMPARLLDQIRVFSATYPAVELRFSRMDTSAIPMALMEETVDLAVCLDFGWMRRDAPSPVEVLLLEEERPCLVRSATTSQSHGALIVTPNECMHLLENTRLIFPSSQHLGAGTADPVEPLRSMLHLPELEPTVIYVQDPDAVSLYVTAGMGVTITNCSNTIAQEKNIDLLEILSAEPFRKVLKYRAESRNPVLGRFLEFIQSEYCANKRNIGD